MQLDVNRFLSDRVVWDATYPQNLRVADTFWDWCMRIISWIFSPSEYTDENIRTIQCFQKYLVDTLGTNRLFRIQSRYDINLNQMIAEGSPLLKRDIAKIVVGVEDVSIEDINEEIALKRASGDPNFINKASFQDLDKETLSNLIQELRRPFEAFILPNFVDVLSGRASEFFGRCFFDPFLADRERMELTREHPRDNFETFMHNMVARVIKREMNVGTIVPAPNHPNGREQYYYVSAKVITGQGMVSYLFYPVTNDTNLPPLRLFRGTAPRNGEIDALSALANDLEKDLGKKAFESGHIYEPVIAERMLVPEVEGGHSLGSTVVQWRLSNMNHIRFAYLYCGPGLPMEEVVKFNQKNLPVQLIIRLTSTDPFRKFGDAHLGYQAPPNVQVDMAKYYPPYNGYRENPHVTVWGRGDHFYGIEGMMNPERRDALLFHQERTIEKIRSYIGPIFAFIIETVKAWIRWLFPCRVEEERGLKIGSMQMGRWHIDHFREIAYNALA